MSGSGGKQGAALSSGRRRNSVVGKAGKGSESWRSGFKKDESPQWTVAADWKPPRVVDDNELQQAKKLFWELDRDGSGSIESDEIAFMLRSMGQNPDEKMVSELIKKFDGGDKDGKIQLREFMMMYTYGLDNQKASDAQDVTDTISALSIDPRDEAAKVPKEVLHKFLAEQYELDVDVDTLFENSPEAEISLKAFQAFFADALRLSDGA